MVRYLSDLREGDSYSFEDQIDEAHVDIFANLSGDFNPIHMSHAYSLSSGYSGRVVHGVLLAGLFSRLVGMYLPGQNSIISNINLKFKSPVIVGARLTVSGKVAQISQAANAVVIQAKIESNSNLFVSGEVVVKVRI